MLKYEITVKNNKSEWSRIYVCYVYLFCGHVYMCAMCIYFVVTYVCYMYVYLFCGHVCMCAMCIYFVVTYICVLCVFILWSRIYVCYVYLFCGHVYMCAMCIYLVSVSTLLIVHDYILELFCFVFYFITV
jgi:hypothetical protein